MDERRPIASLVTAKQQFTCPGHSRPIDRATHLTRLAAFYPACLACEDRHDTAGLSSLSRQDLAALERRRPMTWSWSCEGLEGSTSGQIDTSAVREAMLALASLAWSECGANRPRILVGCDGTAAGAELVSVACHTLALAGCGAIEVGAATTPALATAAADQHAGAVWIGNAGGDPHDLALRFFCAGGIPWSAPGGLERLRATVQAGPSRPRRSGGDTGRHDAAGPYLERLADAFHGLRPLSLVMDSSNPVIGDYWRRLSERSACRAIAPAEGIDLSGADGDSQDGPLGDRLRALGRQVILDGAHFGVWIDGTGEACRWIDERGEPVCPKRILRLLARHLSAGKPFETRWLAGAVTRQQLAESVSGKTSLLVGDQQGRLLLAGSPISDGLAALCLLLVALSQSDRTLSEVLDQDVPDR
jgi:phosphomannomutase